MGKKTKFITTTEALDLIKQYGYAPRSRQTIIDWCTRFGIGVLIGGRWEIDKAKLQEILERGTHDKKAEGRQQPHKTGGGEREEGEA